MKNEKKSPDWHFPTCSCWSWSSWNLAELRRRKQATRRWQSNGKNVCTSELDSAMAGVREEVVTLQTLLPSLPFAIVVDLLSIGVRDAIFLNSEVWIEESVNQLSDFTLLKPPPAHCLLSGLRISQLIGVEWLCSASAINLRSDSFSKFRRCSLSEYVQCGDESIVR